MPTSTAGRLNKGGRRVSGTRLRTQKGRWFQQYLSPHKQRAMADAEPGEKNRSRSSITKLVPGNIEPPLKERGIFVRIKEDEQARGGVAGATSHKQRAKADAEPGKKNRSRSSITKLASGNIEPPLKERGIFVRIKKAEQARGGVAGATSHKQRAKADAEPGKKNRSPAAGFTLIELAMVVLLLGLFAGLSMPVLLNFGQNDLQTSARRLSGTVKYLYNEAALTGLEHRIVFKLAEGSYQGQVVNRNGELKPLSGNGAGHKLAGNARFRDIYQPRNGTRSSGEVTTALLPGGWLEETVIHLAMPDGKNLTLRLVPLTGVTEFFEGYREFGD